MKVTDQVSEVSRELVQGGFCFYSIGYEVVTWPPLAARKAGKCSFQSWRPVCVHSSHFCGRKGALIQESCLGRSGWGVDRLTFLGNVMLTWMGACGDCTLICGVGPPLRKEELKGAQAGVQVAFSSVWSGAAPSPSRG